MSENLDPQWASIYLDKGIDTRNRRIFLNDINEDSAMDVIKALYYLDTISDEPLELFICSYGGSLDHCMAIYDILQTLKCQVRTFAFGVCMSAAPLLLSAGDKGQRWVTEHTQFMVHQYSSTISGTGESMQSELKQDLRVDKKWCEILSSHSSKTTKFWVDNCKKSADFYFTAEQAIAWGIADSIWEER